MIETPLYLEISPLDGRYRDRLVHLTDYFSEYMLVRTRCDIEVNYLYALNNIDLFPKITLEELGRIFKYQLVVMQDNDAGYCRIKEIEYTVKHDVKACEIFLQEMLKLNNPGMIHFGLTSEDINNISYSIIFQNFMKYEQLPLLDKVIAQLVKMADQWKASPFPTHTHGQLASPSTAGKELAVFISRLLKLRKKLQEFRFSGKLNGATGNYSALMAAAPQVDWIKFSKDFITILELEPNMVTTQIEDHDRWAEYFNLTRQVNNIIMDLDQDMWLYLSYGYFEQEVKEEEIGSSTMPHKVNPINFENSEGNLGLSNAMLVEMSNKLCRSRMQRDLSDSTVVRNVGVALSHSYLGLEETLHGLEKLKLNERYCIQELKDHPELLAEPIQTILRLAGVKDAYHIMKQITRGKSVESSDSLIACIDNLDVDDIVKEKIKNLKVEEYTGAAEKICEMVLEEAKEII